MQDNDPNFLLPMPQKYPLEMVADWAGAGRALLAQRLRPAPRPTGLFIGATESYMREQPNLLRLPVGTG
jgi:hypothetical protein